jgi:hypothetical protein
MGRQLDLEVGLYYDTGTELAADGYYGVGTTGFKSFAGGAFPLNTEQISTVPAPSAAAPYNVVVWGFDPSPQNTLFPPVERRRRSAAGRETDTQH